MGKQKYTREGLIHLCRTQPEAAADLIMLLLERIDKLEARIIELENILNQNSQNSHKPPSSDGYKRPQSTRPKSDRPRGGQEGHSGSTLKMVATPDHTITHRISACRRCGRSLRRVQPKTYQRRQVFDIPEPRIEVTEHQCEVKECTHCGATTTAPFPDGVTKAAQYGKHLKSIALYLKQYQLLPSDRLRESIKDLFGCSLSEGTLYNWDQELHRSLASHEQGIKEQLVHSPVIHTDETGVCCEQELQWLHVTSTSTLSHYQCHGKRGTEAMTAIGILPHYTGVAVHDFWKSYFSYACDHALCNAHLLRELEAASETTRQRWPKKFQELLRRMFTRVEEAKCLARSSLSARQLNHFERSYTTLLSKALHANPRQRGSPHQRGRKKQTKVRNLVERLRDYRTSVLKFLYDFRVPFTNNQAERDIRMFKVKLKISGMFRSQQGADIFCRIRGYISTARKNGIAAFVALIRAFDHNPFIPKIIYAE